MILVRVIMKLIEPIGLVLKTDWLTYRYQACYINYNILQGDCKSNLFPREPISCHNRLKYDDEGSIQFKKQWFFRRFAMKRYLLVLVVFSLLFSFVACSPSGSSPAAQIVQSDKPRIADPQASPDDLATLTAGNSAFALSLYQALSSQPGNLLFSPFSISETLAMTYAGARGETAQQMATVFHFTLPQDRLHPAFNALDQQLNPSGSAAQNASDQGFKLSVVNALWGQQGFTFLPAFLDILSQNYGAGMRLQDFKDAPEPSRQAINAWVSDQTQQKIQNLLPQGSVQSTTRLVLTNAVYFKAAWASQFKPEDTQDRPFFLSDGSQVSVPTMKQTESLGYANIDGIQVVELPYAGSNLSMVILLPAAGTLDSFEASLDATKLASLLVGLNPSQEVILTLPKFTFNASFNLTATLSALGMPDAFDADRADFSGMDGQKDLLIQGVLHKAFIVVDEQGTEAAAATGVTVGTTAMPAGPVTVNIDHPFLFLITDRSSGTILFVGRVMDPR
jgi:serpin B